jgi:DNA-binding CsgD family transcriptional regulator
MQDAAKFGLQDGVVASIQDPNGGRTQIAVAGPEGQGDIQLAPETMPVIAPMLTVCFRRAYRLEEKLAWMTQRQRDVFFELGKGRRRDKIACSLSLSLRQVDRHISTIKDRTSKPTIAHAVEKLTS